MYVHANIIKKMVGQEIGSAKQKIKKYIQYLDTFWKCGFLVFGSLL